MAAYASARSRGWRFLLRIEDLDRARCKKEFEDRQLDDLQLLGIDWDKEPVRQSDCDDAYAEALERLKDRRLVFPCFASRKDLAEALSAPHDSGGEPPYPGTFASTPWSEAMHRIESGDRHSWRIRVQTAPKVFFDGFAGERKIDLETDGGDFVVKRADGFFAYQLACAVDDARTGITEVLRGSDLLTSAARQAHLLACLGEPVPRYAHIPLMLGPDGRRLAKRIGSEDLSGFMMRGYDAKAILSYLAFSLGQCEPGERIEMRELIKRWSLAKVPRHNVQFDEEELAKFKK